MDHGWAQPDSPRPRAGFWKFHAALLGIALVVFGTLVVFMRAQQALVTAPSVDRAKPRPLAQVTSALRSMKLITVEIDSSVTLERGDTSWRGDVSATLTVPVRLSYGTDLSKLRVRDVGFSPLAAGGAGAYIVRVPEPQRVSTEVFSEKEKTDVIAGGLRLRSRSGEYYLGLARRDAGAAARDLELRPEDADQVRSITREQVEKLMRTIVGDGAKVRVVFDEAVADAADAPAPGKEPS
ncbi:MAG: DUF4230 domain-containing protein [Tepidisphaera sp.]|nr:DUF4230 domain-containing protein [Tepidisphaera sp.]